MKAHDGLFDYLLMNELSHQLANQQAWYMRNIANAYTYPYLQKGTHRLLGVKYFLKQSQSNNIHYEKLTLRDVSEKLIGAFDYFTKRLGYPKMELLEIGLNLLWLLIN